MKKRLQPRAFMSTRLANIISVAEESVPSAKAGDILLLEIGRTLDFRKRKAVIEVVRMYNAEMSRILNAFFEKDAGYDSGNEVYRVRVCLFGDEYEYLLSKLRFLGKRVRVVEGDYLKKRMLESSTKALERYGVISSNEEMNSELW